MWIVVQLLKDDSFQYVPKIWYHKGKQMCAFPFAKNFKKKLIEKSTPLNMFEHKWLPVKKVGPLYRSLEEARTKMYCATVLSNKQENSEQLSTKVTRKTLEDKILQSPRIVKSRSSEEHRAKTNEDSSANNGVDIGLNLRTNVTRKTSEKKILKSPLSLKPNNSSLKRSNSSPRLITNNNDVQSRLSAYNCPIGKNNIQQDDVLDSHSSMTIAVSPKRRKLINSMSRLNSQTENTTLNTNSIEKKNISQQLNSTEDFKNQFLNSLMEIKDEISNLKSKIILQHDTINRVDTFLKNTMEQAKDCQISNKSSLTLEDIFPLKSEEELEIFEKKIKCNNSFRNNVISILSKLNNINDIGQSVESIMGKMFTGAAVVSQYSLFGSKKKKNFSNLYTYRLLNDIIRLNHNKLDKKQINSALSAWLSLAKFRSEFGSKNNYLKINISAYI